MARVAALVAALVAVVPSARGLTNHLRFASRSRHHFDFQGNPPSLAPPGSGNDDSARRYSVILSGAAAPSQVAVKQQTSLAGKLMPVLSKLAIRNSRPEAVSAELSRAVDMREFAVLALIGWGIFPFVRFVYERWMEAKGMEKNFTDSLWFQSKHVGQAAKVGCFIYAVDCVAIVLNTLGFRWVQQSGFSNKAANVSLILLVTMRLQGIKRNLIGRAVKRRPQYLGRFKIFDQLLNVLLYITAFGAIIDRLDLQIGTALSSLYAFGGVGTLVLSLSSQNLATQLVSGLGLTATERFKVGDQVTLGDGTTGIVNKIGLLYTEIRGFNEIIMKIPNSQISDQRTSNVSNIKKCQVLQTLWFGYDDIEKMPEILLAIKDEIRESCPDLITDGSRPFHVHWRDYMSDHIEVVVDCHFDIPPTGTVYYDNRQKVLEAIASAARKVGVEFSLPSYVAKNVDASSKPVP